MVGTTMDMPHRIFRLVLSFSPLTSSNHVRDVIPLEKTATQQHPAVSEVRGYVEHFKNWRSGANIGKPYFPGSIREQPLHKDTYESLVATRK